MQQFGTSGTLADTIITITCDSGSYSYHVETQMTGDKEIVIRMFEYGFGHAMNYPRIGRISESDGNSRKEPGRSYLVFPEPLVLSLYGDENVPLAHQLIIDFGSQGQYIYNVPTINYLKMDLEELNQPENRHPLSWGYRFPSS